MMTGWFVAGWFWSAPAVPRAVLPIRSDHVLFSPDSRWLLTDSSPFGDGDAIILWDVASAQVHRKLPPPDGNEDVPFSTRSAAFSADSAQLAVGGVRQCVFRWVIAGVQGPDVFHGEEWFPFNGNDLFFDGDRLFRFVFGTGKTWDVLEKLAVQTFKEAPHVRPMGGGLGYLADNELRIVDLRTGKTLGECRLPKHHSFTVVDATGDRSTLIGNMGAGWGPREPILFDRVAQVTRTMPNGWGMTARAISADGAWCATSATGKHLIAKPSERLIPVQVGENAIFDWIANLLDSVLPNHFGHLPASKENLFILSTSDFAVFDAIPDVRQARFAPDGKTLATISEHDHVSLWDFPIPRPVGKTVVAAISVGFAVFVLLTWLKRRMTAPTTATNVSQ
jgi:WD40 repeat protein